MKPFCLDGIHASPGWAAFALAEAGESTVQVGWWLGFGLLMLVLVATDLFTLHRRKRDPSMVESAITVGVWCLLALIFGGVIWRYMGGKAGLQFTTGYLLEWSLSMDNVFVFAVIFRYFQVPSVHQYRILHWGILGAIFTRLGFILAGAALISRFQFILPLFGLFLIYTAYHLARRSSERIDPKRNLVFRFARRWLPLAEGTAVSQQDSSTVMSYGGRFLVRQAGACGSRRPCWSCWSSKAPTCSLLSIVCPPFSASLAIPSWSSRPTSSRFSACGPSTSFWPA